MIATALTDLFGLRHPIVLAPMGNVAGGRLAAAVSEAGGLGMVGGGYSDAAWLRSELDIVSRATQRPWGVGLITWAATPAMLELALAYRPQAVMLSFGDPRPYAEAVRAAGCRLICQVQGNLELKLACAAGADVIVAQGTDAGGHGGSRGTLPWVPAAVDAAAPLPVIAAGGIADGRGLAAALMLGAHGALIGTRFYASAEALGSAVAKRRLAAARAEETARTRVFDIVRGYDWPSGYTGRALRNDFAQRWHGREDALVAELAAERTRYQAAVREGDCDTAVVWAGEGVDLIGDVESAGVLVERIAAEAEARLRAGAAQLR